MAVRFLKLAVVYFVIGVFLGVIMGLSQDFTAMPVHAHVNLLGWVSLAITGFIYHLFPKAAESRLAKVHFWLYNLSLPVMLTALFFMLRGNTALEPVVGVCSLLTAAGVLLFAINVIRQVDHTALTTVKSELHRTANPTLGVHVPPQPR